jgi:hypothetical protein
MKAFGKIFLGYIIGIIIISSQLFSQGLTISGSITGSYRYEQPTDPSIIVPFQIKDIELWDGPLLLSTVNSGIDGVYSFEDLESKSYTVKIPLQSEYIRLVDGAGTYTATINVTPGVSGDYYFSDASFSNLFYHGNIMHDFAQTHFGVNMPMISIRRYPGLYCAASSGYTLDFSPTTDPLTGTSCEGDPASLRSFAIYHEYSHCIVFKLYGDQAVGWNPLSEAYRLGEVFADYLAATVHNTDLHSTAVGVSKVALEGACWDLRDILGAVTTDRLIYRAIELVPHVYKIPDFVHNVLVADMDIYAGVHGSDIINVFSNHGIYFPPYVNLVSPPNGATAIPVSNVNLTWRDTSEFVNYDLHIQSSDLTFNQDITNINTPPYILTLQPDKSYSWKVRTRSTDGSLGPWSTTWVFSTECTPGLAPTLTGTKDGSGHPYFTWTGTAPTYKLYRYECAGYYDCQATPSLRYQGSNHSFTDGQVQISNKLAPSKVYYYVQAICSGQASGNSNKVSFYKSGMQQEITQPIGDTEESTPSEVPDRPFITSYPNPFNPSTKIEYSFPQGGYVQLRIFNIYGQLVTALVEGEQGPGLQNIEWDASGYPSGFYYCRIQAGSYTETIKLLLIK